MSAINNALIAGFSNNSFNSIYYPAIATCQSRMAFQFYDTSTYIILSQITFRNFGPKLNANCGASMTDYITTFLDGSDAYLPQSISASSGIQYQNINNCPRVHIANCGTGNGCPNSPDFTISSKSAYMQSVLDYDGTLSGQAGYPAIIGGFGPFWNVDNTVFYNSTQHTHTIPWYNNTAVAYLSFGGLGIFSGCKTTICNSVYNGQACCPAGGQNAHYNSAHVSLWGSKAANTLQVVSPWSGITGIANTGWYVRFQTAADVGYTLTNNGFVSGAPQIFNINSMNVPYGSFVVFTVAYPPNASFHIYLKKNNVEYIDYPMATSYAEIIDPYETILPASEFNCSLDPSQAQNDTFCQYTGATGPVWYYDGNYLYIRVVNPTCYLYTSYQSCPQVNEFTSNDDTNLWTIPSQWIIQVNVTSCVGCSSTLSPFINNVLVYDVADNPPLQDFPVDIGDIVNVTPVYMMTNPPASVAPPPIMCSSGPNLSNYFQAALGSCLSGAGAANNTQCTLSCKTGYYPVGDMAIYCNVSGLWSPLDATSYCSATC